MQKDYLGTVNIKGSEAFTKFTKGICKTLKAEQHDISVVEVINLTERIDTVNGFVECKKNVDVDFLGNYYGLGRSFDGAVFGSDGVAPTLLASNAHGNAPKIVETIKLCIKGIDTVNGTNTIAKQASKQAS